MTAIADIMLEQIDALLGTVDVELELERDCQVDAILSTAVVDAIASIRAGQPGLAHFQLEAGRLRAQHILDRALPDGGAR